MFIREKCGLKIEIFKVSHRSMVKLSLICENKKLFRTDSSETI